MEFPTIDKLAKEVAKRALDEFTYEGKTLREWAEIIVKQQPCEDCIRDKKAWRLGYERGIYNATIHEGFTPVAWYTLSDSEIEKVEEKIKTLKSQPCEDCISRTEALKIIEEQKKGFYGVERYAIDECHSAVMKLPSVIPRQKVGKWMPHMVNDKDESIDHDVCSECHTCFYGERTGDWKYCPNCGSDNRDLESLGESFADGYEDGLEAKDE